MSQVAVHGTDNEPVHSLDDWFVHAPPEGGATQWRDGYSAKEAARSWTSGTVPAEVMNALTAAGISLGGSVHAHPEHRTKLDNYGRARQHDLLVVTDDVVIGVEAKACEPFDGLVRDRLLVPPPSNKRARCNLMAHALFGRPVVDEETGEVLDLALAKHGYQLWTAAVGTLIEATSRELPTAVMLVQQFRRAGAPDPDDSRNWPVALKKNADQFDTFSTELGTAAESNATDFVAAGIKLHVLKVESVIPPSPQS